MNPIIDHEKCTGCGLCVNDCPNVHLYLENKKAKASETGCIECSHCFAMLQLPKGHKVVSCLVIGYPDVTYQRIAPRKEVQTKVL